MIKPSALQKMKEELEAQEKRDYQAALKSKMRDRIDTTSLPDFAFVNKKLVIECEICSFSTKDTPTFLNHIKTKKHQNALEQKNRLQAQAQARFEAARKEQMNKEQMNAKRPAPFEAEMSVEDIREDQALKAQQKAKKGPSLVSYQDEDEEDEEMGPPGPRPIVQNDKRSQIIEENKREEGQHQGDMIIEKPEVPEVNLEKKTENVRETGIEQTMESYKQFMEEIKKEKGEDADEILKEIQVEIEPVKEEEQDMLEKVIKGEEEEVEDAQDYISNLRKKLAERKKKETKPGKIEESKQDFTKNRSRSNIMEDENESSSFSWKKRGLF